MAQLMDTNTHISESKSEQEFEQNPYDLTFDLHRIWLWRLCFMWNQTNQ